MDYEQLKTLIKGNGYEVADERVKPEVSKTWKMPYCATLLGAEVTSGSDVRPHILKQPVTLALLTQKLDRAEQSKIKTILNGVTVNYTMDGGYIENGSAYQTEFQFILISKI